MSEALNILNTRLASGEISIEEYRLLKQLIDEVRIPNSAPIPPEIQTQSETPSKQLYVFEKKSFFSEKKLFGYHDEDGRTIVEPVYEEARPYVNGYAIARKLKNWGLPNYHILNRQGAIVAILPEEYSSVHNVEDGLVRFAIRTNHWRRFDVTYRWGFVTPSGTVAIQPTFADLSNFSEGRASFSHHLEVEPEKRGSFSAGRSILPGAVRCKYGYIDKTGSEIIPAIFDIGGNFFQGRAEVTVDGKRGVIDRLGNYIIKPMYSSLGVFRNGAIAVATDDGPVHERWGTRQKRWGFLDEGGVERIPLQFDMVTNFCEGHAAVLIDGNEYLIDLNGKRVSSKPETWPEPWLF